MVITTERTTWPLWQCISPEALVLLIQLQWDRYGLKLELLSDAFRELEDIEEIDRLMRQPPSRSRGSRG